MLGCVPSRGLFTGGVKLRAKAPRRVYGPGTLAPDPPPPPLLLLLLSDRSGEVREEWD